MNLNYLIDAYTTQEKMHSFEGERGVNNLCKLVRALGYKDPMYRMQLSRGACVGDLLDFLGDNPGAMEAIVNWIGDRQNAGEWEESLKEQISPEKLAELESEVE